MRTLPNGLTTRTGRPFEFRASPRSTVTIQVPADWRGPDNCDPHEPAQATWLDSLPELRAVAGGTWETDDAGFQTLVSRLADRLIVPTPKLYAALVDLRRTGHRDADGGLARADRLIAAHPDVAELHFVRGGLLESRRDLEAARAAFDTTVALDPDHGEGWIRAGFLRLTDPALHDESLACHRRAVALLPRSSTAGYYLARQLARMDRLAEAEAEMARTIGLDSPAPPDSYMHRARWLHALDRRDEALAVLDSSPLKPPVLLTLREQLSAS